MKRLVLPFAAGMLYCQPLLELEIEVSVEGKTIDSTRLHLRGRQNCHTDPEPAPPAPGMEEAWPPEGNDFIEPVEPFNLDGATFRSTVRSHGCLFAFTVWYDTNGDKLVGPGDYTGTLPPFSMTSGCNPKKRFELGLDLVK